mgnify:CR=1 FL=1|jgi:hypothetical protein
MSDATRSSVARQSAQSRRMDNRIRTAQDRLADLAFERFVREHNQSLTKGQS